MRGMLLPLIGGASAGLIHVLSGPDHLAAIAPLASDGRKRFWATGALWGLGHSSGVFVVGLAALAFRSWLPIDTLSSWSERIVGVVLIAIGLWGLRRALSTRVHSHAHSHGALSHVHAHAHGHAHAHTSASSDAAAHVQVHDYRPADAAAAPATDAPATASAHNHTHAAFAVGILHGLAGSSHFLGVLPALGLPDLPSSVSYLTGYGLGTVAGMTLFASVMGLLAARAHISGPRATRWLLSTCSAAAILVGAAWLAL